jgi:hypothetical protein
MRLSLQLGGLSVLLASLAFGCAAPAAPSDEPVASETDQAAGISLAHGLLGSPEAPVAGRPVDVRSYRLRKVADAIIQVTQERSPTLLASAARDLRSRDGAKVRAARATVRGALRDAARSPRVLELVKQLPEFRGVVRADVSGQSMPSVGGGLGLRNDAPDLSGVPDLGRGPDGRFGDDRTGASGAASDLDDLIVFFPGSDLEAIDEGTLVPDPESRLGAYAATRGYPPGTVGNAVHRAIGTIYLSLGNYGEERIGRVFNSPEALALYNQPVDSPAGALMAAIEFRYWQNVAAEDPFSAGGQLGSAFDPEARDWLQRNVFGTTPEPGEQGPDAPTDCGDKSDGWYCMAGSPGFMVLCSGRQIAGGCPCAACGETATAASCSAPTSIPLVCPG